jgi:UDP-2,3-diacylglucosamine pyrophosphatase LpxH
LEAVCLEITKPQSKPFIVTTIYRPPNANAEFFDHLEKLIKQQIDDENKEMYILGDLNFKLLEEKTLQYANKQTKLIIQGVPKKSDTIEIILLL